MNRYNSEGYYDPTAYAALVRAGADARRLPHRPLVFICSPYAGDIERNTENARRYCRFAVSKNCIPVAPHLFSLSLWTRATRSKGASVFPLALCCRGNAGRSGCSGG